MSGLYKPGKISLTDFHVKKFSGSGLDLVFWIGESGQFAKHANRTMGEKLIQKVFVARLVRKLFALEFCPASEQFVHARMGLVRFVILAEGID